MPSLLTKDMLNKPSSYSIPLLSWIDIEWTDTFLENEYKLLRTKSKQTVNFKKMHLSLPPSKKYTKIEEFKDELKDLKNIFNEIKELKFSREQEINEIKNETKRKLNMLDDEINDILEKLDVGLTTLELRCRFCERAYDF